MSALSRVVGLFCPCACLCVHIVRLAFMSLTNNILVLFLTFQRQRHESKYVCVSVQVCLT